MKKIHGLFFISLLIVFANQLSAAEKYIHFWQANNVNWISAIQLTNVCEEDSVTVTVQLWYSDSSYFANHKIGKYVNSVSQTTMTDSNGKFKVELSPNQTVGFYIDTTMMDSYKNGYGKVISFTDSGKSCLVGGYTMERYDNGASFSYLFNNGNAF